MGNGKYRDKVIIMRRMLFVFSILFLLFFVLIIKLCTIMIGNSDEYKAMAIEQWTSDVKIDAKRGKILDRRENELAMSANVNRVDLDLNTIRQGVENNKFTYEELSKDLAEALDMDEKVVYEKITKKLPNGLPMAGITLKRRVEKAEADKVNDLNIRGVIVSPDTKRYYPNNNFLSQVIGHTNSDGEGLTGVEYIYDKELSGVPGRRIAEMDRRTKNELPYNISEYTKPVDGKDLVLTIDYMIQLFCEKAAEEALIDNNAKAVSIIVTNPNNGEILAMVNKPDYNLNEPWEEGKSLDDLNDIWRNRAISDSFEPGSIFKVITAATALEENIGVDGKQYYNCTSNGFKVGNHTIRCANGKIHGSQDISEILKNSCNVGFAQLGTSIGKEKLTASIEKFGFGKPTGIDLPGESKGIVKDAKNISDTDLATISFGQTNTVSPIQYITAFNAVANGGTWIRPHVMKEIIHYDENNEKVVDKTYDKSDERRVMSEENAATLRTYLEKVVSEGGGKEAFIEGYKIAGKTGTAQKPNVDGRGYASGKYRASFAAMAPSDNPELCVFISIDEPNPSLYYAGLIAAPVAKKIFNDSFNYLALKPDSSIKMLKDVVIPDVRGMKKNDAIKILKEFSLNYDIDEQGDYIIAMTPAPGYTVKEGSQVVLYTGATQNYTKIVTVPSLIGYSKDKAVEVLNSLGLKGDFVGTGVVSEQSIVPGTEVDKGVTITFQLENVSD